jgi:hypothetical protein
VGDYNGPTQIGYARVAGRGTSYSGDFELKRVRIWVDGVEYKPEKEGANTIREGGKG